MQGGPSVHWGKKPRPRLQALGANTTEHKHSSSVKQESDRYPMFAISDTSPKRGIVHWCVLPGCFQFLRGSTLKRSFAPFCALLRSCVCALLHSFAHFCVRPRLEPLRLETADFFCSHPREANTLIFKIRSWAVRSDLLSKHAQDQQKLPYC